MAAGADWNPPTTLLNQILENLQVQS